MCSPTRLDFCHDVKKMRMEPLDRSSSLHLFLPCPLPAHARTTLRVGTAALSVLLQFIGNSMRMTLFAGVCGVRGRWGSSSTVKRWFKVQEIAGSELALCYFKSQVRASSRLSRCAAPRDRIPSRSAARGVRCLRRFLSRSNNSSGRTRVGCIIVDVSVC